MDLKGVNIPLFKAQGFTMTRSNGEVIFCFFLPLCFYQWEASPAYFYIYFPFDLLLLCFVQVITPYYFAYEDLLEDWESAKRKLHTSDSRSTSNNNAQSKTVAGAVLSLAASGVKNVFSTNGQPRVSLSIFFVWDLCCCKITCPTHYIHTVLHK